MDDASAPDADQPSRKRKSADFDADSQKDLARRSYEPGALEGQPRITELIPQKRWVIALLMFVWLSIIAGIVYLQTQLDRWSELVSRAALAPIDLAGVAGVATWFSSATLLLAAVGSWQVYNVRRHKTDDYRGTYRLWFWTAAWLVFASLESTASLRVTVQEICLRLSGSQLAGQGDLWWMLCFGVPSLVLAARLAVEMRKCKTAVTLSIAAGLAYVYAAVFQAANVPLREELVVIHRWSAVLVAHCLVLATIAVYARHVLLDALGQMGKGKVDKAKKPRRARSRLAASQSERGSKSQHDDTDGPRSKSKPSAEKKSQAPKKRKKRPAADQTESTPAKSSVTSRERAEKTSANQSTAAEPVAEQTSEESKKEQVSAERERVARKKSKKQKRREQAARANKQQSDQQAETKDARASKQSTQNSSSKQATTGRPQTSQTVPDFTEVEDEQPDFSRLSKAERRRLRKQRRHESRRAA